MPGDIGLPSKRLQFNGEQLHLEERTTDPGSTEEGEAWLRTDVAPDTDQIGTLRFDNGDGTWDIPIFQTGTSGEDVEEVLRIPVGSTVGYIPIAESGEFSQLGFQHSSTRYALHDAVEFASLPDSGDLHAQYDATKLSLSDNDSVSSWGDETGNGHDLTQGTAAAQPTYIASGINGNPVVRFDGTESLMDVVWSELSQPNHIFIVFQLLSSSGSAYDRIHDSEDSNGHIWESSDEGNWRMWSGNGLVGSAADTNAHIAGQFYNEGSSTLRIDGSEDASGNVGTNPLDGFRVGADAAGSFHANVDVGEILIYPEDKTSVESDVESYLSDKWGITV